jgi:hypothetical protein
MARRNEARWVSVLLTLVAFVLTHQAVFLYTYGRNVEAALSRTGHGLAWEATVLVVLALGAGLAIVGTGELVRLARMARVGGAGPRVTRVRSDGESVWSLAAEVARTSVRIGLAVAAILVLTENVEHAAVRAPLPGFSVFAGAEYAGTVPILLSVAMATALVHTLYRWRRSALIARLRAIAVQLPRPLIQSIRRPRSAAIAFGAPLAHRLAGRAPPVSAAA